MHTEAASPSVPDGSFGLPPEARSQRSLIGRALGAFSTVLVVALLLATAYWGHETGWTFSRRDAHETSDRFHGNEGIAVVRTGPVVDKGLPPALRHAASIEFSSAEAVDRAGIDIVPTWRGGFTDVVTASGELSFDPTRVARLSARAPGSVWRVLKTVGDPVRAGDVLALVDAVEVGKAKAEFQQALVQVRLRRTALEQIGPAGGAVPAAKRREAEAAVKEAEVRLLGAVQALHNLGLSVKAADFERLTMDDVARRLRLIGVPEGVDGLSTETASANLLPVRSPLDGVLLSVDVVGGEVVDAARVLFVVVDARRVWLTLHVGPEEARRIKVSQSAKFRPDGGGEEAAGVVTWVGTAADEMTRTIPVRVELANESGLLRASTLGRGRVVIREEPNALVVPADAVHRVSGTPVVFVRDKAYLTPEGPKAFHVRPVTIGGTEGQNVEVAAGLADGEIVASKGSRLLVAELERQATQTGHDK